MSDQYSIQKFTDKEVTRKLDSPYFLFRTQDRLGSYFDRSHYRIVYFHKEPFSKFLPPAKLDVDQKQVVYSLENIEMDTLTRMEYLPDTLVTHFEKAARTFYGLDGFDSKTNEAERKLRRYFRLPDPLVEPDAYWLYGPRDDRKLLILWGTEFKQGSSLPLCPVEGLHPDGETILDRLKAMQMSAMDKNREIISLLEEKRHPLAEFLGKPLRTKKGELQGLVRKGKRIELKELTPLGRLWPRELKRFERAVESFYDECFDEDVSPYERELRLAFKVPDPDNKEENCYFLHKGKLVILLPEEARLEHYIYLDECDDLMPDAPSSGQSDSPLYEEALLPKLRKRVHPKTFYTNGAIVIALFLVTGSILLWKFWIDSIPPKVLQAESINNPQEIKVVFSEKIDPNSLDLGADENADDPLQKFLVIETEKGTTVKVLDSRIDSSDEQGKTVLLRVEEMQDGSEYRLVINGIQDTSIKTNQIEPDSEVLFQPLDTIAPQPVKISAHPTDSQKLLIVFSEPLDERSSERRGNFEFPNGDYRVSRTELLEDQVTLEITASRSGNSAEKGFVDGGRYTLLVSGITDASFNKNVMEEPYEFSNFEYIDTIAPHIGGAKVENQFTLRLQFSEPLSQESAANPENYSIQLEEGEAPEIIGVTLDKENPGEVIIKTDGFFNGHAYTVEARNISDNSNQLNTSGLQVSEPFLFSDPEDRDSPVVVDERIADSLDEVTIEWNEPVNIESARIPENYVFVGIPDLKVIEVLRRGAENKIFTLVTNVNLEKHRSYQLEISNISDRVGNVAKNYITDKFKKGWVAFANDLKVDSVEALSSSSIRIIMTEDLHNFENRISNPSYFVIKNLTGKMGNLLIKEVGPDPENKKAIRMEFDASTPMEFGRYLLRIEPGLRVQENRGQDQGSMQAEFTID